MSAISIEKRQILGLLMKVDILTVHACMKANMLSIGPSSKQFVSSVRAMNIYAS